MTDTWTPRLSEYIDDDLPAAERAALEAHLAACADCRGVLADLRRVVTGAHALVDRPVAAELWSGIAERIGASGTPVVALAPWRRRRLSLSLPQLAAAAALLLAVGGAATALALRPAGTAPVALTAAPPAPTVVQAGLSGKAELSYDTAVRDLEAALDAGRDQLSPETVTVLSRNLARVDAAIAEARQALAADPANAYLTSHLATTMRQKLALLQQAATLARAAS
ncbi:MAG TPA: zf-HC2 domain-containing protein [Gemmatimonadales bacterium]|nr:zf-HC2 domain-containing protein [Gemmatimonadales bacterium]